jgi:hypothetical protein
MRRPQHLCVGLLLATGSLACDSAWTLDLTVRVSARRLAKYMDYPAQIVLVTDRSAQAAVEGPEGYAQRIANICAPTSSDFSMELELSGDDCNSLPRYVQAWIEPREEGAESECGALDDPTPLVGLRRPPSDALQAEAVVFEGHTGDCDGLRSSVTLSLDW